MGVNGAWSSQVVIATQVIIEGEPDGLFVYNGTPTLGNLIASISPAAGTDPYGNHFLLGITTYNEQVGPPPKQTFVNLAGGIVAVGETSAAGVPDTADQSTFASSGVGSYQILSGHAPAIAALNSAIIAGLAGKGGQTTGNTFCPNIQHYDELGTSDVDVFTTGSHIKMAKSSLIPYTWQNVANGGIVLGAGWASNTVTGGAQDLEYRLDVEDNLVITGTLHTTSATPAATIFTLAAPYVPKTLQRDVQCSSRVPGTTTPNILSISASTGNVSLLTNLAASSTDLYINAVVPLGNIP